MFSQNDEIGAVVRLGFPHPPHLSSKDLIFLQEKHFKYLRLAGNNISLELHYGKTQFSQIKFIIYLKQLNYTFYNGTIS